MCGSCYPPPESRHHDDDYGTHHLRPQFDGNSRAADFCPCGCQDADNGTENDPVVRALAQLAEAREAFEQVELEIRHFSC